MNFINEKSKDIFISPFLTELETRLYEDLYFLIKGRRHNGCIKEIDFVEKALLALEKNDIIKLYHALHELYNSKLYCTTYDTALQMVQNEMRARRKQKEQEQFDFENTF